MWNVDLAVRVLSELDHDERVLGVVGLLEDGSGTARLLARFEGLRWSRMDRGGAVFRRLPALSSRTASERSLLSELPFFGDR